MKRQIVIASALALLAVVFLRSAPAAAQVDVFVRIGDIRGDSKDDKHKDWIEAKMLTDGMKTADRGVERSFVFTKALDRTTPSLKLYLLQGKRLPDAMIEICKSGTDKSVIFSYRLRDVTITSVRTVIENGATVEEVSLNFGSVEWSYVATDASGKPSGTIKTGWDFQTNKPI